MQTGSSLKRSHVVQWLGVGFGSLLAISLTNLESSGKREPQLKNWLNQSGPWASLWGVFLIAKWCRKNSDYSGQCHPLAGCIRCWLRTTNQSTSSILHGFPLCFCLNACLDVSQWWIVIWHFKSDKPCPLQDAFDQRVWSQKQKAY